jgi:hypothetical protein
MLPAGLPGGSCALLNDAKERVLFAYFEGLLVCSSVHDSLSCFCTVSVSFLKIRELNVSHPLRA